MKRGLTLPELCLSLAIIGLLLAIALPRFQSLADGLAVNRAAHDIAAAHRRARIAAVLQSRQLDLVVSSSSLLLRPSVGTDTVGQAPGPASDHVLLAGPPRTLTFSPVGFSLGVSNASFVLTRGGAHRTVIVSRLGRLRLAP